ncbi:hypothetical protein C8J57DRAFT_1528728 [Mycena rebaudengoi]|nr:hypothetical protein C8J57DRAFT_1528728 [Mycena rebaudengoi]
MCLYDWTEKWLCGHSGKYRDERDHNLSPRKRRPNRHHPSVKVQCGAYFFLCKVCGEDRVKIEHCWEHDGHEPGTVKDMAGSMLPLRVKEWIENRVADGLDWKAIKSLLRVDAMILDKLDFPESLRITQADVYNALRRRLSKLAHLDPDGRRSLELWKEKLEMLGYSVLYQPVSIRAHDEHSYVLKKLLLTYNKVACFDSIHNTCFSAAGKEEKAFLYTVVLKNLATGKGCPAAFMITPSEAQYAITDFIRWLRVECKFICSVWMIDCSEVEAAGITSGCGFAILLFLCFWHVMKAVAEQAKKSSRGQGTSSRCFKSRGKQPIARRGRCHFRRLLNAITTVDFDKILNETHVMYPVHPDWLKYLNTQWLPKKHRWAMAYRQIDTNNCVESWHHHLKSFCLKLMRKQHVDVLLHILTEQAEPDFRRSDIPSQQKERSIPTEDLDDMIDYTDPEDNETSKNPNIYIHTCTGEDIWYLIKAHDFPSVDNDSDTLTGIISCECPEFELKCKHMFFSMTSLLLTMISTP